MFPEADKERWDFARKLLRPGQTRLNSFSLICVVAVVSSLKINFQRRLTKCPVPTDLRLPLDILCLTKNINAIEQI
jgi:hypothetical protein